MEIYLHTKCRWDNSIRGWDITTSGFGKRPPYWNYISGFDFDLCIVIGKPFCICLPIFVVIGWSSTKLWRHIRFSRWRPAAILDLMWVILDDPRSAIVGIRSVVKFGLDPIYIVLEILRFLYFAVLAWNCLFTPVLGAYFSQIWSPIVLTPKRTILLRKHVVWAIKRENRSSGLTWAQDREKKVRTGQDSQNK